MSVPIAIARLPAARFFLLLVALAIAAGGAGAAELKRWSGGRTPELVLKELNGTSHDLAAYRGKVVLVNFWATWCEPCREEMPSIQQLKQKLAGRPFVVLAVNLDEPEARIRKYLSQMALDFIFLLDPERKVSKAWNVRILPATFLIGPSGRIHYSLVGELDWSHELVVDRVRELLPAK